MTQIAKFAFAAEYQGRRIGRGYVEATSYDDAERQVHRRYPEARIYTAKVSPYRDDTATGLAERLKANAARIEANQPHLHP